MEAALSRGAEANDIGSPFFVWANREFSRVHRLTPNNATWVQQYSNYKGISEGFCNDMLRSETMSEGREASSPGMASVQSRLV